ncbi:hypothetical protein FB565_007508 [Actinoplanes lutulentus]|uniref:Uncharacterized protein n=1 Tax=Actinoplanes lutulentus TaxID=1287878 RepID=A0A327Z0U0_9ACTN|nr:hypothetical protein [Actinoplanes lutulentus]MBB2947737.1 hypothetical protein [Actinoplanes lutulentus]RAK27792.1 hypothetical protein B0I29_122175 [Actinoplanes lutulentus]
MLGDQEVAGLYAAADSGDLTSFQTQIPQLWRAVAQAEPSEATEVLERITGLFERVPRPAAAYLAVVAGRLVDRGAAPGTLPGVLADALVEILELATGFVTAWRRALGSSAPLPAGDGEQQDFDAAVVALTRSSRLPWRRGSTVDEAVALAGAWFTLGEWQTPVVALLHSREVRADFPRRPEITALITRLREDRHDLQGLRNLLAILDDEPLIVVHREQRRGYRVRISGVGDNFQLYTLLADTLIGDPGQGLLDGDRPEPSWVAAATTGPADAADQIDARFQLTDGDGQYIPLEGRPADIPLSRGSRVIVLDRVAVSRSWDVGRRHDCAAPEVRLDEILTVDEVDRWLSQVAGLIPTGLPAVRIHLSMRPQAGV